MNTLRRTAGLVLLVLMGGLVSVTQAAAEPVRGSVREYVYITYRAPAPPLGACTAPTDSDSATAFALAPWHISPTLNVTLSNQNVPTSVGITGFESALSGAINAWEATALGDAFGSVTQSSVKPRQRRDGQDIVGFGRIGSAVGLTRFWIDTADNSVIEFDTLLNSKYPWSTDGATSELGCTGTPGAFDVQSVLTHELGHPVGLEHFNNDVQTMYPFVATGETRKRTLAAGDTAGANTK